MNIPLSKPDISSKENSRLSVESLQQLLKVPYAVTVNSTASALHLAVKAAGLKPGDEVITTPYSFAASSNCLLSEGVIPVFTDIDPDTLNMDVNQIAGKITPRTKAIMPVHTLGQIVPMDVVMNIAREHRILVIENACEALGAKWNKQYAGTFGDLIVMTTGEGGILLTRHKPISSNFKMSAVQLEAGLVQLEQLEEWLNRHEEVAERYLRMIREYDLDVQLPKVDNRAKVSWFIFIVLLPGDVDRKTLIDELQNTGVQSRPYFPCIHLQHKYAGKFGFKPGDYPIAEKRSKQALVIPFYSSLQENEQKHVIHQLSVAIERSRIK